ncbi:MAG: TonB-dependent receptor [Bacteroidetes bacterium]|jgi:outer membrane receptor for ferrienterochelin and colicins|nr:TonB-dependent receptor [Bacteroidota bacterium]MBT5527768.1 TonB-dependent receptor [Cytophagia bacterium]MBT3421500.1 TonB-dependent receptor [Bacteroidota bacterium]MBT3800855.1 TonB-dependent receptor [Bacteroidota bacterium]MBT3935615.1 TonB-dependent receptor [Bacteroidota bacterium]
MKQILLLIIISFIAHDLAAQNPSKSEEYLKGYVYGELEGKKEALVGASVYWMGTNKGTATTNNGAFSIRFLENKTTTLVVSFIGYQSDTLKIKNGQNNLEIVLKAIINLDEYEVKEKRGSSFYANTNPIATQIITSSELTKAACCNLAESFETNASVDVSYSDAVTGAKQIQLLGLSGVYTQMQFENIPEMRGIAGVYGLTFVPGPWLSSISISKGTASVRNGFESITGQINYEYKKPDTAERFYLNLFGNNFKRVEGNLYSAWKLNKKWSTMVFVHANEFQNKIDLNGDGFLDIPTSRQYNVFNRWKYKSEKLMTQFGVNYISEQKGGGQLGFNESTDLGTRNAYGIGIDTRRLSAFWKAGHVSKKKANTSLAMIHSFQLHEQNSYYGLNNFDAKQSSWYSNFLYQSYIGSSVHNYTLGASVVYDNYDQKLTQDTLNPQVFQREDIIPGVFLEYTFKPNDKFALIAGIRDDYHNHFGNIFTPRLHVRYKLNENTTIRASGGKGYRFPSILTENTGLLLTNKQIIFEDEQTMEEAWNYGLFLSRDLMVFGRKALLNIDFYRTNFIRQMIVDMDVCGELIHIYELNGMLNFYDGKSYANSAQAEFSFEPLEGLDVLVAYRFNDVKTTYLGELKDKLMSKKSKALLSLSYSTKWEKWQFDYTLQYNDKSRLPIKIIFTDTAEIIMPQEYSPSFFIMNGQVTRRFKSWEVYLGVENATNFTQAEPIEFYDEPFSLNFDATRTWGPVIGRKIYLGIKMKLF